MIPSHIVKCGVKWALTLCLLNVEQGSDLGIYRWVVERTLSWLHQFRRLRYARRSDIHETFLALALAMIVWNFLDEA